MGSLDSLDSAKGSRKGVLQQQQKMSNSTTELFTEGKFSYHVLTPAHKDAAHAVLARAFCSEPACSDVAEVRPDMKTEYIDWLEFVDYWMDHCSTNGLSLLALMTSTKARQRPSPRGWASSGTWMRRRSRRCRSLVSLARLSTSGSLEFTPITGSTRLCIKVTTTKNRGNKIANFLTKGVMSLLKKSSFKFGTIEATNAFTSKAATWNKFTAVYSMEAKVT